MMISARIFQWLFFIFGLSICISNVSSKDIRVVCYYTNWSVYRPGTAKFSPQNINPYLCTHLIYAFGGFTKENTLKPFDKYQDIEKGGYAKFTGLKTYNKDLKTLLAIGGWNEASSRFSPMVANAERRKQLVKNSIKFLRQNNFDGLDLDWEYPAFREGGKPRDKENYAKLVQELREEFERESEKTGRTRLLLTMAVPAGIEYVNKGYDIPKLTKYLDWMNILSYDYHSAFEPAVNHHAPLYPMREATEYDYDAELNIDYTIKHYLELGADPSKLVMGIPTYGRSYTLFNPDANAMGDPADGPGEMGEATRENGYLAYYEICENVKSNDWTVVQPNERAMGPYAFKDNQWVGYDDENIARKKAEYVAQNGLGGIMFWAIDNDDFRGSCHGKPYPLIEAAKEALIAASGLTDENLISPPSKPTKSKSRLRSRTKTTVEPSTEKSELPVKSNSSRRRNRLKSKANNRADSDTKSKSGRNESKKAEIVTYSSLKVITPAYTTPEPPSTPDQGGAFKCEDEGFFPHPKDCKKYFWCLSGPGELGIVAHQFTCPAGLYFNKAADSCDYSQNVLCNKKLSKTTSTTEGKKKVETTTTTERVSTRAPTTRTTTKITTTTEEEYDDEYEYEDEDIHDSKSDSEEDPKVIKELLDLIKKAGGIEELEKQLNIGHEEAKEGATTPSTRTKSIVEKLLSSRNNKNTSGNNKYANINRNSRGPQSAGILKDQETKKRTDKKPQYTTISRNRPSVNQETSEEIEDEPEENEEKSFNSKYTNIRRSKGGLNTNNRQTVDRNKILGEEDKDTEDSNRKEVTVHTTPQYVNIRRQRPTTTEHSENSSTSRYVSIRRSTTVESPKEEEIEESSTSRNKASDITDSPNTERITPSLRYQILNRQSTSTTPVFSSSESTTTSETTSTEYINTTKLSEVQEIFSTEKISSSTSESVEEPTSSPSSSTVLTSSTTSSTEEPTVQTTKSPIISEPRPFSVEQKSTISTTYKPVVTKIRSTTSPTKAQNTRLAARFRIRSRPKTTQKPTSARATYSKYSSTTSRPRSTKPSRRKYPHYSRIESQVTTTAIVPSEFVSQTVSPRVTTMMDQALQSTNQQFMENESTELGQIAFSLLQKAPLPSTIRTQDVSLPYTTTPVTIFPRATSPRTRYISSTLPLILTSTNRFSIRRPQTPKKHPIKISEGFTQYDDIDFRQLPKYTKVILHSNGVVECLDQGNFPHPASCKKFISCAKMENGKVLGWEYTCPKNLSFDPIGGICNWSAELGCDG